MERHEVDDFGSRRSTVHAPSGVVATSQPLAAEAGVETLRAGGNAFDAAVATAAALNVVEPTSTGLGGDVFALYRTADGEVGAMRACGGAPADATRERVRSAVADDDSVPATDPASTGMPTTGPHTVTVPGTARGWEATVRELGTLSLASVLAPAIRYALDGYPVSPVIAAVWRHAEGLFAEEHGREAYLVDGERAPEPGEVVRLPELGRTMERIAEDGADVVYEGEVAEAIAGEVQEHGGFLTVEDLAAFEPEFVDPISTEYAGAEVFELPPNNQGPIVLEALNVASELDAGDATGVERVHRFVEATKRAFHDGHRYVTDPGYEDVPPLTSREWARKRAEEIDEGASSDVSFLPRTAGEDADTVLLCVADAAGNVVSYINSRFAGFGSGLVAGDTGIALQNRGASFSLDDDHPNRLEPGKRPFHTLIPGLVRFDGADPGAAAPGEYPAGEDWAAFGVMGGYMQPQGHVQVLSHLLDDGATLQEALDAPRWRYREDGRLAVEARYPNRLQNALLRRGHDVEVLRPGMFGGGQIARWRDGVPSAATEPRKDGTATGY